MLVLGIESSCDETAIAIINEKKEIIDHVLFSQIKEHQIYGGVVPEIAARSHTKIIDVLLHDIFTKNNLSPYKIDVFAATCGPGLFGGLMSGSICAKTLALVYNKPFIAVNHLAGHSLLPTMFENIQFPFLLLLVSGGHTQFLAVLNYNKYVLLGQTIDDAIGECFDKSARMLGLPYPGGIYIEKLARQGNSGKFALPRPLYKKKNCNFSFSGLKTAVKELIASNTIKISDSVNEYILSEQTKYDIAASLQKAIAEIVIDRTKQAINSFEKQYGKLNNMVISGGVSANITIREQLNTFLATKNIALHCPPIKLCTDNAIMIAWAALLQFQNNDTNPLDFPINTRWKLNTL